MRTLRLAVAALALFAPACGPAGDAEPDPSRGSPDANVRLYVSNQSFARASVDIRVEIDGVTVVDDDFRVEGQHTWKEFGLELAPGKHILRATSDEGDAILERTFRVRGKRWIVLNYWCCDDETEPRFTLDVSARPVAFA